MATQKKKVPESKAAAYLEAIGRRKTATARVRITPGPATFVVNGKTVAEYFQLPRLAGLAAQPLAALKLEKIGVTAKVSGGGIQAQAEAVRHGLARALVLQDEATKPPLRAFGHLTRDSRMVERKKFGKLKARRSPQWQKR